METFLHSESNDWSLYEFLDRFAQARPPGTNAGPFSALSANFAVILDNNRIPLAKSLVLSIMAH